MDIAQAAVAVTVRLTELPAREAVRRTAQAEAAVHVAAVAVIRQGVHPPTALTVHPPTALTVRLPTAPVVHPTVPAAPRSVPAARHTLAVVRRTRVAAHLAAAAVAQVADVNQ